MTCSPLAPCSPANSSSGGRRPLSARFAAWRAEHRRRVRLAHELDRLDATELADLGISRADFSAIIHGTYRR